MSKKPGGFKSIPRRKPRPDCPPAWAMTLAQDLIAKMDGYGDLSLIADAEMLAYALEYQWRDGYRKGRTSGETGIVEFVSALVEGRNK